MPHDSSTRLSGLSGVSIRRPVFTTMMMTGLVVLGIFSYRRLAIDEFPEIDVPVVAVQTVYAGASSETVEREVTRRLAEAFNPVAVIEGFAFCCWLMFSSRLTTA